MVLHNNILPFGKFKAINLFGVILYKGDYPKKDALNHETIHTAQMKEMLYIFFYLWYGIEWFIKVFKYGFSGAYANISFEREANKYRYRMDYLSWRKHFKWFSMI